MSYIQKVLQPGETLIYRTRLHWLIYGRAILLLLIAIACVLAGYEAGTDFQDAGLIAGAFFLVLALISAIHGAIKRASTELAVTDHRVIFKRGIVSRYTIEMARSKVESVDVEQSIAGRIFNYGTILVRGTGGSLEPFRNIEDPLRLRSAITAV
ncbi:MAG TPA: PH domain-containing protein [Stellaceae bacterium]|jgi:uncharacterized membrane protein YdbT with pleckstrin-like domain|nr:PH domain-containing protein [Stellaceae bacterium]